MHHRYFEFLDEKNPDCFVMSRTIAEVLVNILKKNKLKLKNFDNFI